MTKEKQKSEEPTEPPTTEPIEQTPEDDIESIEIEDTEPIEPEENEYYGLSLTVSEPESDEAERLERLKHLGEAEDIPVVPESKYYLHLVSFTVRDSKGKKRKEYKNIVSVFDKHLTHIVLKQRTIVNRFGYDTQPCDYWDLRYITDRFHPVPQKEIGVFFLAYSSAMADMGLFTPKVLGQVTPQEVAVLLDASNVKKLKELTSDNNALKERIKFLEEDEDRQIKARDTHGDRQFAKMAEMSKRLSKSDQWEVAQKKENPLVRMKNWFDANPNAKTCLIILILVWVVLVIGSAAGILRIGG